jgi:hypothetical protein
MKGLKKIEMGSVLRDEDKRIFDGYMKKNRPDVEIVWKNLNTVDLETCMPELPWRGKCIKSHTDLDLSKFVELPNL